MDWLVSAFYHAVVGVLLPVIDFVSNAGARYFWLYCVSGLLIAAYAYRKHRQLSFEATLFDRETWLGISARNDYFIVVITPVLRLTIFSFALINWQTVSSAVVATLAEFGVSGQANDGSTVALGALLTVALFVADDFLRWYVHYTFHRIPELWEFHKVHHSAEVLNFATSERHHPVEVVATGLVLTVGYGVVNGVFIALFGDKLTVTTIAGANVFLFVFNIAGGVLRHSPFWISYGERVERWVISPAMHQIHHSNKVEHFDRNLGGSLAVWDRLAGTLHIPRGREIEGFGIGDETEDFRSLRVIFIRPFAAALRVSKMRFATGREQQQPSAGDRVSNPL